MNMLHLEGQFSYVTLAIIPGFRQAKEIKEKWRGLCRVVLFRLREIHELSGVEMVFCRNAICPWACLKSDIFFVCFVEFM